MSVDVPSIDFSQIRPYAGDQRKGFEEFVCQLARRESIANAQHFRRIEGAGGDGGVEAYWLLSDGKKHAYQAKYHLAVKDIDWSKIDNSVETALVKHPEITKYTIAIPCDLTDRSGAKDKGKTGWEHWDTHKLRWEQLASTKGMSVEFCPWTKSELVDFLATNTTNRGLMLFWFNALLFDNQWFYRILERTVADLDERYQPQDNVELDLKKVFDGLARSSAYRHFLSQWFYGGPTEDELVTKLGKVVDVNGNSLDNELINNLTDCCKKLKNIGASVLSDYETDRFPLQEWQLTIKSTFEVLASIIEWLYMQEANANDHAKYDIRDALKCLRSFDTHLDHTPIHLGTDISHDNRIEADWHRAMVVIGEAGIGKSHLFADVVSSSIKQNSPAILLLGQHFPGLNLKSEFLDLLDLRHFDFDTVLQALNTAGESARTRLVIMIDAINETGHLKIWRDQLAGFVSDVLRHDWLAVAVSLRPEYEDILIPEKVSNSAVKVFCYGIQSQEEQVQAAIQYFEKRGITRPAVPWLAPEFSNFLFLKTCCDSLRELGEKEFPKGLHGSLTVLKFYLESILIKLRRRLPESSIPDNAVQKSIKSIAEQMADKKVDYITEVSAVSLCEKHFGSRGPSPQITWFATLTSEGVFRKDHIFSYSDDPFEDYETVYRFTYQRFADHLIVKALLRNIVSIDDAFSPNGPVHFLVKDNDCYAWYSLLSALAVQIPEKFPGKELIDLLPEDPKNHQLNNLLFEIFEQSLLWRAHTAFSDRTRELFNLLPSEWDDPRISIIIRLATVREHPWNAESFLDKSLKRLSMSKRDALWSVAVNKAAQDDQHPLWILIYWCLTANLVPADTETMRLATITLGWIFTSSHRPLRDKATKAMISLFSKRPEIIPDVVGLFSKIDDLYVLERICASVLGTVSRSIDRSAITAASYAVYSSVFSLDTTPLNLNLRDYARAVVEYALKHDCLDEHVDIQKCRPPYKSEWPLKDITEDELKALAERTGGDEILGSAFSWGGDFGTYEIEYRVHNFTDISLDLPRPLNEEEREVEFNQQIERWDIKKQIAYLELKKALAEKNDSWRINTEPEGGLKTSYSDKAIELVNQREQEFTDLLDEFELGMYNSLILPVLVPDRFSYEERSLPQFDSQFAKRWVAKRAYELGWNRELFPKDRAYSDDQYSRNRPKCERIGKKYQWLAFSELMACLSDNVWTRDKWPERALIYDHPATDWFVRDIEPSILTDPPTSQESLCWWQKFSLEHDPIERNQLRSWPFSAPPLNVPDWMDTVSPDGTPWLLLYGLFSNREKRTDNDSAALSLERQTFVRISTILVDSHHADSAMKKLKGCRLSDPSGHECLRWTDGPFLCEYPWRNTWEYRETVFEEGRFGRLSPSIKYIRPVAEHTWEGHLDLSLKEGFSSHIPHPWMAEKMGLKYDFDQPGSFVSALDNPVFFDPSIGYSGSSAALINKTKFFEFLKNEGLDCIWIVAGERNSYPSGNHGDFACRYFASTYRWSGSKWFGDKWHHDETRG